LTESVRLLLSNSELPISIGYISDVGCDCGDSGADGDDDSNQDFGLVNFKANDDIDSTIVKKVIVSIPLDIYTYNVGFDLSAYQSTDLASVIDNLKNKKFNLVLKKLLEILQRQSGEGNDEDDDDFVEDAALLFGITLHNIAVVNMFAGQYQESTYYFKMAVDAKKISFGDDHRLVADSLNELGILYFAQGRFNEALSTLKEAKAIRIKKFGPNHPKVALTTNNIACIEFLLDQTYSALAMFKEGKDSLRRAIGSSMTMVKLDLLHVATVTCNLGYMEARLKNYDEARAIFEEVLIVQQSVLGDNHETVIDTQSNIDFTNAFHS